VAVRRRVLAEAAVDRIPHVLLVEAERLPARDAVVARAAGVAEPRHPDAIADLDFGHCRSAFHDTPNSLVAGDERRRGLDRPVAMCGMDVGVAEAGGLDLDADLVRLQFRWQDLFDHQRAVEVMNDSRAIGPHRRGGRVSFGLSDRHDGALLSSKAVYAG